jgi:hypothetical protein
MAACFLQTYRYSGISSGSLPLILNHRIGKKVPRIKTVWDDFECVPYILFLNKDFFLHNICTECTPLQEAESLETKLKASIQRKSPDYRFLCVHNNLTVSLHKTATP